MAAGCQRERTGLDATAAAGNGNGLSCNVVLCYAVLSGFDKLDDRGVPEGENRIGRDSGRVQFHLAMMNNLVLHEARAFPVAGDELRRG